MKAFVVFVLTLASLTSRAADKAYLDLEDDQILSVFNKPGMNWKVCSQDPSCKAVGWPDSSADIEVLSRPEQMSVMDPHLGVPLVEEYIKIKYSYTREANGQKFVQTGEGWVDAAFVSYTKQRSFYGKTTEPKEPPCPPSGKSKNPLKDLTKNIQDITKNLERKSVVDTAQALKEIVGQCVINPQNRSQKYAAGNPYDNYVLPYMLKKQVPAVAKENGQPMTQKDLIDIDSLARTMYAEMARCYKNGLQYPMTVAKIAVNRANAKDRRSEFIRDDHNNIKSDLAKVVTSPTQFSLWLKQINGKANSSLPQALCPPANKSKAFWTGSTPPGYETDIWDNTVKIATEAVLFPKQFNTRTKQVRQFHYTSGLNGFHGMKQVFPSVENRKVSKDTCLQVWDDGKN